jgi:hypothetical protein
LGLPALAGPEVLAAAAYLSAAALLITLLRPDPLRVARERRLGAPVETLAPGSGRLLQLVARPYSAAGLGAISVANLVMVGVMTMVPVHLMDMGDGLGVVGGVVSLHIAGMFAPSVLSGRLVDRIGGPAATAVGGTLLVVAGMSGALAATSPALLALAMIVLGIGWNVSLIAGSTLLTARVPAAARPRLEGLGDLWMGMAAAGGGAISGPLMALGSYATLAVCGAAAATVLIPLALIARRSLGAVIRTKPPSAPSGAEGEGALPRPDVSVRRTLLERVGSHAGLDQPASRDEPTRIGLRVRSRRPIPDRAGHPVEAPGCHQENHLPFEVPGAQVNLQLDAIDEVFERP